MKHTEDTISILNTTDALAFGTLAQRSRVSRQTIQNLILLPGDRLRVLDLNLRFPFVDDTVLSFSQQHCDWLKLSSEEYSILWQRWDSIDGGPEVFHTFSLEFTTKDHPERLMILTRGSDSTQLSDWQRQYHIPIHPCTVVDTIGAGDAYTAAMLCLHLEGRSLEEAGRFASRYAARVCEHPGATPTIDRSTILEEWK